MFEIPCFHGTIVIIKNQSFSEHLFYFVVSPFVLLYYKNAGFCAGKYWYKRLRVYIKTLVAFLKQKTAPAPTETAEYIRRYTLILPKLIVSSSEASDNRNSCSEVGCYFCANL